MKTTGYYTRVSTNQQDTRSQLPELQAHAKSQDNTRWFSDKASGKTMDRPGWQKLQGAINAGEIGTVVVWRLDRLGRTAKGLAELFADLIARKINLVSLKDGIDLATPAGRLVAHVMASVGQYETEVRAERVQAGQAVARAKGIRWGGSLKGKVIKTSATPEQVATIRRMVLEKIGITAIASATGLSRTTVYKYI
jgi:DNA invertase Pin-like site-specific DNA recombinase